jgi:hypothetical protein
LKTHICGEILCSSESGCEFFGKSFPAAGLEGCPATEDRAGVWPACFSQFARHPGARGFVWSSTQNSNQGFAWQVLAACVIDCVSGIETDGTFEQVRAFIEAAAGACVGEDDLVGRRVLESA